MILYRAARLLLLWSLAWTATKVWLYGWGMAG